MWETVSTVSVDENLNHKMANPNAGKLLLIGGGIAAGAYAAYVYKQKMDDEDGEKSMYDVPLSKLRSTADSEKAEAQSDSEDTNEEKSEGGWFSMGKTETKNAANCPPSHFKRVHKPCSSIWNTSNENDGDDKVREKRSFIEDVFGSGEGEDDQSIIDKIMGYLGLSGSDDEDRATWFGKSKEGGGSWFGSSSEDEGGSWFGSQGKDEKDQGWFGSQDKEEEDKGWFGSGDNEESKTEKVEEATSAWLGKTEKDTEDKPWFGSKDKEEENKTWFGKKEDEEDQGWFGSKDKEADDKPWFGGKDKEEDATWFGSKDKEEDASWFGSKDKETEEKPWFGSKDKEEDASWFGSKDNEEDSSKFSDAKDAITEKVEESKKWLSEQGEGAKELLQGKKDVSNENKEKPCFFSTESKGQSQADKKSWFSKDTSDASQEGKESAIPSWLKGGTEKKDNKAKIDDVSVPEAPSPVGISKEIDDERAGKMVLETASVNNPQSEGDASIVQESPSSATKTSFFGNGTSESKEESNANCPCEPEPEM